MADRKGSTAASRTATANGTPGDTTPSTVPPPAPAVAAAAAAAAATAANMRPTSPYGTRSRNRGARVNYAEDKDNDMDYEFSSAAPAPPARPNGVERRASTTTATGSAAVAKDSAPSTAMTGLGSALVPPATAAAAAGKKRKSSTFASQSQPVLAKESSLGLSNMPSFEHPYLKDGSLVADDGTVFSVHDHIYLICEPPGEPYYLARIMEFLHANNDPTQPIETIRVNWYYRPKDIHRKVTDTRVIFASMHSDQCPLTAIRGKCYILHRSEIDDIDEFRKVRDSFYFEKMFDRYIQRYFDVIPTTLVRNVPEAIRRVLVQRWKYLLVEPQRAKELCAQMKECKRCAGFCATNDSVHCAVCGSTYHMNCVRPPLLKKPSRGFAWACGPCNRAQERKLEARNTPTLTATTNTSADAEEEAWDEEEEDLSPGAGGAGTETPLELPIDLEKQPTPEQANFVGMWQMRYLGQHCRVEDALDYDDRIFPRAASRLGPRHQAVVPPWPGRPVEYVKPAETKKKNQKNGGKGKNANAVIPEAKEKRPEWVQDEPLGYVRRGEDDGSTSTLLFKVPCDIHEEEEWEEMKTILDNYMEAAKKIAGDLPGGGIAHFATNFLDKASELLFQNDWNPTKAMEQLRKVHVVKDLKEPKFKPDETKRFEEGVAKFGSELHSVAKVVKTRKEADIVRFYYQWKKTPKGKEIWGNFEGRRGKKEAKKVDNEEVKTKLLDDVADEHDDSAFDMEKAMGKKRGFECKFCRTRHSRQWRRAPAVAPGTLLPAEKSSKKKNVEAQWLVSALCRRCAELWRRYAIHWEDPEEVQKKVNSGGGRAWKRRIDEELLKELTIAQADEQAETRRLSTVTPQPPNPQAVATPDEKKEPPKKKAKTSDTNGTAKKTKEKEKQKEKEPAPPPEPPKPKIVPCGVCSEVEEVGKQHAICRDCKLTVHKSCYGVGENRSANKWICDMCNNDKNPTVSTSYECCLCPCRGDFAEGIGTRNASPVVDGPKKKGGSEKPTRESSEDSRKKDADRFRPQYPRESLKKTAGNNWAHVICAVWTPEVKFAEAKSLKTIEGVPTIPITRWQQECKVCGKRDSGACVSCTSCHSSVHIGCANRAQWAMGFDIQPVKVSRRDVFTTVKIGDTIGNMTPVLWCSEHKIPTGIYKINSIVDEETGQTALELYVTTYKQADLALTGTVRKANLLSNITSKPANNSHHRRTSTIGPATASSTKEGSPTVFVKSEGAEDTPVGVEGLMDDHVGGEIPKRCIHCHVDVSPLWWKAGAGIKVLTNGTSQPVDGQPLTNGFEPHRQSVPSSSHTVGLVCHRCHCQEEEQGSANGSPFSSPPNGGRRAVFTPLPPLAHFLAQQHPPPPPPPPPQSVPQPVVVPQPQIISAPHPGPIAGPIPISAPVPVPLPATSIAHITNQMPHHAHAPPPHMIQHPMHHVAPPTGPHPGVHHVPPPPHMSPPVHMNSHMMPQQLQHHVPHPQPPHHSAPTQTSPPVTHQPSPHIPPHTTMSMSPRALPPQTHVPVSSVSPHLLPQHVSPPLPAQMVSPHALARPLMAPQAPQQVPVPSLQQQQLQQGNGVHPPPPPPLLLTTPGVNGGPPPPPQAQRVEERRVMSGASGSPALANLLS